MRIDPLVWEKFFKGSKSKKKSNRKKHQRQQRQQLASDTKVSNIDDPLPSAFHLVTLYRSIFLLVCRPFTNTASVLLVFQQPANSIASGSDEKTESSKEDLSSQVDPTPSPSVCKVVEEECMDEEVIPEVIPEVLPEVMPEEEEVIPEVKEEVKEEAIPEILPEVMPEEEEVIPEVKEIMSEVGSLAKRGLQYQFWSIILRPGYDAETLLCAAFWS